MQKRQAALHRREGQSDITECPRALYAKPLCNQKCPAEKRKTECFPALDKAPGADSA
jgi:hypothetical protein